MTDSTAALRHQITSASELQSVVRTMRALAASSIHQYEQSVLALADYRRAIDQGLGACLRSVSSAGGDPGASKPAKSGSIGVIVFGSDQGLVGQFNTVVVEQTVAALRVAGGTPMVWAVGERVRVGLVDAGVKVLATYPVPRSAESIGPLVDRLLVDTESHPGQTAAPPIELIYNRPMAGALYEPVQERVLPLDAVSRAALVQQAWPAKRLPEVLGQTIGTLRALIREHLFISLFQACAQSQASENASRLAAMERADKNIDELLTTLRTKFHGKRQMAIDEELFDLVSGYAALGTTTRRTGRAG